MSAALIGALGAASSGLAVVLGAFGAHALKTRLDPADLVTFEIGVRYQMYHGLALLGLAALAAATKLDAKLPALCFLVGTLVFSGSLYVLVGTGLRWLGAVTPLGGLAFIAGWSVLAWRLGALR